MRPNPLSTAFLTVGLLCAAPLAVRADDASRRAKCAEMLKVTNSEQMMVQMVDSMQKMQTEQLAKIVLPPEARASAAEVQRQTVAMVQRMLNWETLKPRFIELYAATYTEPELDGILAFYKSPAGRAMLDRMPQLMEGAMKISQDAVNALVPEMNKIIEEAKQKK